MTTSNSRMLSDVFRLEDSFEDQLYHNGQSPPSPSNSPSNILANSVDVTNPMPASHALLLDECTRWGAFAGGPSALNVGNGNFQECLAYPLPLTPGWQERVIAESRTLMANCKNHSEILDLVSSDTTSRLSPAEEEAICAVVPKLVRASSSGAVRGVYLDRSRALWRANWREGGKVRTKGFRIAKWGTFEARRKAIEVRKLMETRACFLRLKAVAYGYTKALSDKAYRSKEIQSTMDVPGLAVDEQSQYDAWDDNLAWMPQIDSWNGAQVDKFNNKKQMYRPKSLN